MQRLIFSVLCLGAVALAANSTHEKNVPAAGYYGGTQQPAQTQQYYVPYYPPPPQIDDRNVCDLDASVLLVTDARKKGQNKAVRVRCSEIANYDEDTCNVCCQNAARRDRSLQNQNMYGFLAVVDELKHNSNSRENSDEMTGDDEVVRRKRSHNDNSAEVEYTTLKQENWKPDAQNKNIKCVCCAPKRALPQPQPVFAYQPVAAQYQAPAQTYGQTQAAPAQQYPAQPVQQYQAPVQQYPQAQAPAPAFQPQAPVQQYQAQPAPVYQAQPATPIKAY